MQSNNSNLHTPISSSASSSDSSSSYTTSSTNSSDLNQTTSSSSSSSNHSNSSEEGEEEVKSVELNGNSENKLSISKNIDDTTEQEKFRNDYSINFKPTTSIMGKLQITKSSINKQYVGSTSSSSTKQYRNSPFGLKNHFITMPDQDLITQIPASARNHEDDNFSNIKHDLDCMSSSEISESISNYNGYRRHHQKHSRPIKSLHSKKHNQNHQVTKNQPLSTNHLINNELVDPTMLISDAGLDADKCNAKQQQQQQLQQQLNNNNYNNNPYYLNASSPLEDEDNQQQNCNELMDHSKNHYNGQFRNSSSKGISSREPASLLIRFSSIMYATFLVILGCIFHISELRQKSKNSSDHIYTIVVAFVGIVWLLFLQIDLLRYKRFASRYILIGSMFNNDLHHNDFKYKISSKFNHNNHPNYKNNNISSSKQLDYHNNYKQHNHNHFIDPSGAMRSSRSNSSSAASLLHDRLSLNTEVIFKKTAYKMYEQERQRAALGRESRLRRLAAYQNQQNPANRLTDSPISEISGPTNPMSGNFWSDEMRSSSSSSGLNPVEPAYKFLHGKMGANFYLKCGMAAFCFGHVIHEGLRFGQQVYFFGTGNSHCRDSAALVAHLITPLYSFYQLFMMFKYSNVSKIIQSFQLTEPH